jgi:hypothetical protein
VSAGRLSVHGRRAQPCILLRAIVGECYDLLDMTLRHCIPGLTLGALVVSAAVTLTAQGQTQVPYAATRLIERWAYVMHEALEGSRAYAGEDVVGLMEEFVSPGAVKAVQDKLNEEQLKKADDVAKRFALAMVKAGQRRPDGSIIVDDATIEPAKKAVCPAYPFCN